MVGFAHLYHMKNMNRAEEAMVLLKQLAAHVKPLIKYRGLSYETLQEFYQRDNRVHGMHLPASGGRYASLYIRLRSLENQNEFLDWDTLVETLLHEMCHSYNKSHGDCYRRNLSRMKYELEKLPAGGKKLRRVLCRETGGSRRKVR